MQTPAEEVAQWNATVPKGAPVLVLFWARPPRRGVTVSHAFIKGHEVARAVVEVRDLDGLVASYGLHRVEVLGGPAGAPYDGRRLSPTAGTSPHLSAHILMQIVEWNRANPPGALVDVYHERGWVSGATAGAAYIEEHYWIAEGVAYVPIRLCFENEQGPIYQYPLYRVRSRQEEVPPLERLDQAGNDGDPVHMKEP